MKTKEELLKLGFKNIEGSNRLDFICKLILAYDLGLDTPIDEDEELYWEYYYSFDEMLNDYRKIDKLQKRNEPSDIKMRISFIPDSQKYYFSFVFSDNSHCSLDVATSSLVASNILDKSTMESIRVKQYVDSETGSYYEIGVIDGLLLICLINVDKEDGSGSVSSAELFDFNSDGKAILKLF